MLAKVAVTLLSVVIVTWQVLVPVHAPPQPVKTEPGLAVSESVSVAPDGSGEVQPLTPVELHLSPAPPVPLPRRAPALSVKGVRPVEVGAD